MHLNTLFEVQRKWFDPEKGREYSRKRPGAQYVGKHGLRTTTAPEPAGPPGTPSTAMPTLHLTYPDGKEDKQPWILYLGSFRTTRRPGQSKKKPEEPITYVMGIKLNKMIRDPSYSRLLGILRNRIPDITKQSTGQGRARRVREIFRAFDRSGTDSLFHGVYRTYAMEPGLVTTKHQGITGSASGEPFTYLSIDQVAQQWGGEEDRDDTLERMQRFHDLEREIFDLQNIIRRAERRGQPTDELEQELAQRQGEFEGLADELDAGREEFIAASPEPQPRVPGVTPDRKLPVPPPQQKATKPGEGIPTLKQAIRKAEEDARSAGTTSSPQRRAEGDLADDADKLE